MESRFEMKQPELFCVILNYGYGSRVVKVARQNGISGGTVFLGKGTAGSHLLKILDITDIRKEIVLLIAPQDMAFKAMEEIDRKIDFDKPNHGIAFTLPVAALIGVHHYVYHEDVESEGERGMYKAIFVVVDKGTAESVIDAAASAGSKGGTIINARGSGIHENQKLFSMEIEPEKEIVLILSETDLTEQIAAAIRKAIKLDEPGNGIMFILDINKTYGL